MDIGDANPQRPPPPPGPTSSALRATPNGPTGKTQGAHHPGKYLPRLPTKLGCVTSVAHIIVPSCTEHAA